jgi:single-strand DNA-binding protein
MLIGNLGKDPDVQYLEGNIGVAKFSLATTETFKDRTGKLISQTEWHTVVLWSLAELAQKYLHKEVWYMKEGCGPAVGRIRKGIKNLPLK